MPTRIDGEGSSRPTEGDLFLDEIGDIPLSTQVKLLRVLQEKEVERVGDHTPIPIDVRLIAATHRNLEAMCREGTFREDLYYRLNVIPIRVPPLRERQDDIPLLVDHFIRMIRVRTGKPIHGLTGEALSILTAYSWPGNVRELINVLEYAFVVCQEECIGTGHLPALFLQQKSVVDRPRKGSTDAEERKELIRVLEKTGGSRQEAARMLKISRVTLWKLLKKHAIIVKATVDAGIPHGTGGTSSNS